MRCVRVHVNTGTLTGDHLVQASRQRPVANCKNGPFLALLYLVSQNDSQYGEVDVIGVDDNGHNQIVYRTAPGASPMTYHRTHPLT